ncbi:hypothetical protein GGD67_002882 [Bradyrhizobium sp. IAR9]|nr:hypothetical protein [Bradyrhizobium sp. IAR9]
MVPQVAPQRWFRQGEPQRQLVGAHGRCGSAIGVEAELALLDAVFHVATGAVDVFVELPPARLAALERGDDETYPFGVSRRVTA